MNNNTFIIIAPTASVAATTAPVRPVVNEYQRVTRGDIFASTKKTGNFYQLVRVMADVPASYDSITGKASYQRVDVYNLINTETGKTRVSTPDRMLRVSAGVAPTLKQLNNHFGLDLTPATSAASIGGQVKQAIKADVRAKAEQSLAEAVRCIPAGYGWNSWCCC